MTREPRRLASLVALSALAVVPLLLFRLHIIGRATFIGNPDRLNTFLNVLKFHVDGLARGRLDAWDEYMFMGFNTFGLPYTFPNPLAYLTAAAGSTQVIRTAGFISCLLLVLAGWSSYAFIRDTCKDSFFALVGAVLYQCSALTILKVSQNDMSFAVFILIPLMMLVLRRTRSGNAAPCFAALAILFAAMLTFTFLQKAAYAIMLGGAYALYRGLWLRNWRPAAIYFAGLFTGLVASLPRLYGVAEELLSFTREAVGHDDVSNFEALYEFQNIRPRELLRWFYDGMFGRFPEEASRLGNNINLTEGMLLYSSAIAVFLVLFALARYRGGWFRMLRFRDEDVSFHALFASFCFAVVLIKPVQALLHVLFLSIDLTHARILIAAQLSVCTLTALALQDLAGGQAHGPRFLAHWKSHLAGMAIAVSILLAISSLAGPGTLNERILLEQPPYRLAVGFARALAYYPPENVPRVPTRIAVTRLSMGSAETTWRDVGGEDRYEVQLRRAAAGSSTIQVSADTTAVHLDNLLAGLPYTVRIRACYREHCSPFSAPIRLPEATTDPLERASTRNRTSPVTWLLGSSVRWVDWLFVVFVLSTGALRLLSQGNALQPPILGCLAFLMIFEAFIGADYRVNGDHTRSASIPFRSGTNLMASPGEYRAPKRDALQAFAEALDTSRFRSVLVCNPEAFPSFCAPYLSQFWQLRVVEGYTSGLPARLAGLPWPNGVRSLRAISFPSVDTLNWPLLSLLNVKYAVAVNEALYRNHVSQPSGGRRDAMPGDVPIMLNPLPVVPRQFFTARTVPASRSTEAALALFPPASNSIPIDPTRQSVVEGLGGERAFATGGHIEASYKGDRIDIAVEPSTESRFLVLNEAYDPRWHAYAGGREVQIYPTNVVMRGIELQPGIASITFHFVPFVRSAAAVWLFGAAAALLGLGFVILKRLDRPVAQ